MLREKEGWAAQAAPARGGRFPPPAPGCALPPLSPGTTPTPSGWEVTNEPEEVEGSVIDGINMVPKLNIDFLG